MASCRSIPASANACIPLFNGAPRGVLGNLGNLLSARKKQGPKERFREERRVRGRRLTQARWLCPDSAIQSCMRNVTLGREVAVVQDGDGRAGYAGLMHCGLRACPWCAHRQAMRDFHRATAVAQSWVDKGSALLMVHFTMRHKAAEPLLVTKDAFVLAQQSLHSGRPWRRFADSYAIGERFYGNEITDGENGWHFHRHTVYEARFPAWVRNRRTRRAFAKQVEAALTDLWIAALAKFGREALPDIAVRVSLSNGLQEDAEAAAHYVTKFALEATSSVTKDGRGDHRSPWQLLDDVADSALSDAQRGRARARFREFVDATKGIHWSFFSEGCRAVVQQVDAEHTWGEDDAGEVVLTIDGPTWACLRYLNKQVELLEVLEERGLEATVAQVEAWCHSPAWLERKNSYQFEKALGGMGDVAVRAGEAEGRQAE